MWPVPEEQRDGDGVRDAQREVRFVEEDEWDDDRERGNEDEQEDAERAAPVFAGQSRAFGGWRKLLQVRWMRSKSAGCSASATFGGRASAMVCRACAGRWTAARAQERALRPAR
jgi:hypothetical protein